MKCPPCAGTGTLRLKSITGETCTVCDGHGNIPDHPNLTAPCPRCLGTGIIRSNNSLCSVCNGIGRIAPVTPTQEIVTDNPYAFFVESGKPRTAHLALTDLFSQLEGPLAICDPYYGLASLLRFDSLRHCTPIRFLTKNANRTEATAFPTAITEWRREHGVLDVRLCVSNDLHDRFLLTPNELIILGHGLKDIGNKDSFIVRLPRTLSSDLLDDVLHSFDSKWSDATPI